MSSGAVASGMGAALGDLVTGLPSTAVGFGLVYAHPAAVAYAAAHPRRTIPK